MPTVYLAPGVFGAGGQMFTSGGVPLDAGLVYTSIAGGTTPAATYTTSAGNIQNANPIELNADGRFPSEVWLEEGVSYRFTLRDSADNLIGTYDNLRGVNDIGLYTTAYTRTFLLADSAATARDILVLGDTDDVQFGDIASVGDLEVDGGAAIGGLLDISAATAGQIKFPATQNASADVNTLDDYEEGTWTPNVGGTATYSVQLGTYTKIGNLVTVTCRLVIDVIGTGALNAIDGLPFTSKASPAMRYCGSVEFQDVSTNIVTAMVRVQENSTQVTLLSMTAAGTGLAANNDLMTSGTGINFTLTYNT